MTTIDIDRATIARKRAEAESLELQARRLRSEASEIERNLFATCYASKTDGRLVIASLVPMSHDFTRHMQETFGG